MSFGFEAVPKVLRVPEGVSGLLRDLVHERTGIFFENGRMNLLLEKLEPLARLRGCESFLSYYYTLKDNDHGEWDRAWEALSVQETYFYREMAQINALVDKIIPEWFQKTTLPFRIWSAASATGEEPYTIAMALEEKGFGKHPIEIFASDASPSALEKAHEGIYRP
ncbi:MAG TPA: CheR family methyltransferase, partial [Verrucomicrobiae bacterium]|nr:CheR family methyltransferase [Verrucomicrobiae bacterium]